jgi:hypothetical protein
MNWRIIFNKAYAFSLLRTKNKSIQKSKSHTCFQPAHDLTHNWKSFDGMQENPR